jgi:sulfide:quinone oxidoreductase
MAAASHHKILIVGGGAAGITVASELRRHDHDTLDIAIVEPSEVHYYQPALTLVGAGAYSLAKTRRQEAKLIPAGVTWIKDGAAAFAPDANSVTLGSGRTVTYDYLVVCPGLVLDWDAVRGLRTAVGSNGVCSNYAPETAEYTWETLQNVKPGTKILCTQPPMPFKCPGAPQKIAYLAADYLRRGGIRHACEVRFLSHAPAIFGVPFYARELVKIAAAHGIIVQYQHNLVEVDGPGRTATFEIVGGDGQGSRVSLPFDMLHATPPQTTPAALKQSPLANAAGFVDVHANSLQHVKYKNVFGLGDAASTANSKTAAAVRKQAPVVVRNLQHLVAGRSIEDAYDGYAACPLTTAYGKVLMAEFIYGGKPTPTLPLNPAKDHYVNWWIKTTGLPHLYWDYMLKGHEAFPTHNKAFAEPPAA